MNNLARTSLKSFTLALLISSVAAPCTATDDAVPGKANAPFTLDEALGQLKLYPKDAYLQYVALQLARRDNRVDEVAGSIFGGNEWNRMAGRREDVDLFSIFTGALAVQESLQLDTMRGGARGQRRQQPMQFPPGSPAAQQQQQQLEAAQKALEQRRGEMVEVATLTGPTIKSHPWKEMLGSRKSDVGSMSRKVPEDFFFAEFASLTKLLDVLDSADLWGKHLLHQTSGAARSQQLAERLKKQLVVETNPLLRNFYDLVVEEVAATGSDLFFNEGSDLTMLFKFKQPAVFKTRMDGFLLAAAKADSKVVRSTGKIGGLDFVHLTNADRSVHVYSAYPEPDLHVRSNSLAAFERVLAAIRGKTADGQSVPRLGDSDEFKFIRTLMPRGAKEEDGFLYLSDAFIRRLVGPGLKLTERRRVLCYNHLRMIGHASLMHRSEAGRVPESLAALEKSQCSPGLFGAGDLVCPDGGKYSLSADGTFGVCSHHGHSHELVPCLEHPVAQVTGLEADEYNAFLQQYNQFWRTFFDPIGIRIKASPEQYRLETIVLPLIDNTVYTGLAMALGGKPEPLDALPVPERNIMTINFRFDKDGLAEKAGLKEPEPAPKQEVAANNAANSNVALPQSIKNLRQIGLAMHNYHEAYNHLPASASFNAQGKPLLSWRVALLPYVDQAALYQEFHLDEPWDSEHNKKLINRIPPVYQGLTGKANKGGKTTYLAPVGKNTIFTGDKEGVRFADVTDGLSNTILIVQSDELHAVPWTSPQDLAIDPKTPAAGLVDYPGTGSPVIFTDGSVRMLRKGIEDKAALALFTRNAGEPISPPDIIYADQPRRNSPWFFGILPGDMNDELGLTKLILKGLGNQVGMHIYDAPPTFDFNLPSFLGESLGSFSGRGMMGSGEMLPISFLIASLNAPVYLSLAVQDPSIVDEFLNRLDGLLAAQVRERVQPGWFRVESDFYRVNVKNVSDVRCGSLGIGPLKFRIFWARIGNGLYIASKPFILEDLGTAQAAAKTAKAAGPTGHAMFRIRSRNWNQVLPDFRLGWAESNRHACLDNLGPLSSVARALAQADQANDGVCRCADHLHGAHFFCPEGGRYVVAADGRQVTCSVHGSALAPRQAAAPAQDQSLGKLLGSFAGLEATLTFLEDGLHAVLTIERGAEKSPK